MVRESIGIRCHLASIALALCVAGYAGIGTAEDPEYDDPSRATSGNMEDHEASSGNPDDMTAESHDAEEITVESETMDSREAEAIDPDKRVTHAGTMDDREASSTSLTDLEASRSDGGYEAIEVPGKADWADTMDPAVLVARKNLLRAEKRAVAARTAYGQMMQNNYPRGAARVRIVDERDASMEAFEQAKTALAVAEDG